jgi:hypothetical protein
VTAPASNARTQTRRRWLLFVPLLLLALGSAVWLRSAQTDPRFVGAWRIAGLDRSADATVTLKESGLGHWPRTLSGDLEHFPWTVREGRFLLGWPARPADWWLARNFLSRLVGRIDYPGSIDLEVVDVSPHRIILRQESNSLDIVLTRNAN